MMAFLNNNDVWTSYLDGSGLKRLTEDRLEKTALKWTSDGKYLLFIREGCLFILDPDSGKSNPVGCYNSTIDFARDMEIAIIGDRYFYLDGEVAKIDQLYKGAKRCQFGSPLYQRLSWDGKVLASIISASQDGRLMNMIQVQRLTDCETKPTLLDLFPAKRFTMRGYAGQNEGADIESFGWNGDSLFALHGNVKNGFGDMVLYSLETGRAEVVNPIDAKCCYRHIDWSPDGEYLIFAFQDHQSGGPASLYYIPFDSLHQDIKYQPIPLHADLFSAPKSAIFPVLRPVPPQGEDNSNAAADAISISASSPDALPQVLGGADKLAFISNNDIWMVNFDGSGLERITSDRKKKTELKWTPDGKALIYQVDGCLVNLNMSTRKSEKMGCFRDLQVSPDMRWSLISDVVQFPNVIPLWMSYLVPYDLPSLSALKNLPQLMAGCPFPGGRLARFSPDASRLARVSETSSDGKRIDMVEVLDLLDCSTPPKTVDTIPSKRFSMRGYSGPNDRAEIMDFGWDGYYLFALSGNVINGFGDLHIYNMITGRADVVNPINDQCCYQGTQFSPNSDYIAFAYQDSRFAKQSELYYIPFGTIGSGLENKPIPLPKGLLTDPTERIYLALRPSEYTFPHEVIEKVSTSHLPRSSFGSPIIGGADKIAVINDYDIWIADLDGSKLEKITKDGGIKTNLRWSPDGLSVIYQSKGCWLQVNIKTQDVTNLGCYFDLSFSPDGKELMVSSYQRQTSTNLELFTYLTPANLTRLLTTKNFFDLQYLGSCLIPGGRWFQWSLDGELVAQIVPGVKQGVPAEDIYIYERHNCQANPLRLDIFPSIRFTMRGYSEVGADHTINGYGWNGKDLFALNGNLVNGYSDLILYDKKTHRSEVFNPLNKQCCYNHPEWSPDGSYMVFAFQSGKYTRVYFEPFETLGKKPYYIPFPFPDNFFSNPQRQPYPALRPASVIPVHAAAKEFQSGKPPTDIGVKQSQKIKVKEKMMTAAFNADGSAFVIGEGNRLQVYDPQTGFASYSMNGPGHDDLILSAAFSPNGDFLASASADRTVILWRLDQKIAWRRLVGHTGAVNSVAYSPDGALLASASSDTTVKLWRTSNGGLFSTLRGHQQAVFGVAFSPDGEKLASVSLDGTAMVWEVSSGRLLLTLKGHRNLVKTVAFSPDGSIIATGSYDGLVLLWNSTTGDLIHTLEGHTAGVESVWFSPDGKVLVSGGDDGVIGFWDVHRGKPTGGLLPHNAPVLGALLSPNGDRMLSFAVTGELLVWDVR